MGVFAWMSMECRVCMTHVLIHGFGRGSRNMMEGGLLEVTVASNHEQYM